LLERSHIASCRLYLWKAAIGYNVHPSIQISSTAVVADIAAGTGMWLVDMAQRYPTVQFEGFDNNLVGDTPLSQFYALITFSLVSNVLGDKTDFPTTTLRSGSTRKPYPYKLYHQVLELF
jgi:hypothetical protein